MTERSNMRYDNHRTEAELVALTVGQLIGAAMCCDDIEPARVESLTALTASAISNIAEDGDDLTSAKACFSEGVELGKAAVTQGEMQPERVEAIFSDIEQRLAPSAC